VVGRQRTSHEIKGRPEIVRNSKYRKVIANEKQHRQSNRESSCTSRQKRTEQSHIIYGNSGKYGEIIASWNTFCGVN